MSFCLGSLTRPSCPSSSKRSGSSPCTTSTRSPTPGVSPEQEREEIKPIVCTLYRIHVCMYCFVIKASVPYQRYSDGSLLTA